MNLRNKKYITIEPVMSTLGNIDWIFVYLPQQYHSFILSFHCHNRGHEILSFSISPSIVVVVVFVVRVIDLLNFNLSISSFSFFQKFYFYDIDLLSVFQINHTPISRLTASLILFYFIFFISLSFYAKFIFLLFFHSSYHSGCRVLI